MRLSVRGLTKEFPTPAEPLRVLRGVDLDLPGPEAVAITGVSGSGKSTLLHILGTLDRPTAGTVRYDDVDPFALADAEQARFRNRRVGFVFQDHHLLPQCDVLENVLVPTLVAADLDKAAARKRAEDLLGRVGLGHRLTHRPGELSGGERQRAAVARALIMTPQVVLADEPTGNLDPRHAGEVGALLLELQKAENLILLVVTHSRELAAAFPRTLTMRDGALA